MKIETIKEKSVVEKVPARLSSDNKSQASPAKTSLTSPSEKQDTIRRKKGHLKTISSKRHKGEESKPSPDPVVDLTFSDSDSD